MSGKRRSVFGGVALVLATVVVASQGCGSSSSGNFLAACENTCNKEAACEGYTAAYSTPICMSSCEDDNRTLNAQTCPNLAMKVSMLDACNAMPNCAKFEACVYAIPACGTSGSGGSNGSGGSSGTGGSGGADCSTCAHSHTCCLATDVQFGIPDGAGCEDYTEAQCTSLSGSAQTQYIATCSNELLAGQNLYVAACQ
jgi:hypothetical protein